LPQRISLRPVDVDPGRQREGHRIVQRTERADLRGVARLLRAKLVAREADHHQAPGTVLLPQALQPGVLRREAAPAGHVDQQQPVSAIPRQGIALAFQRGDVEIESAAHQAGDRRKKPAACAPMPFDTSPATERQVTLGALIFVENLP